MCQVKPASWGCNRGEELACALAELTGLRERKATAGIETSVMMMLQEQSRHQPSWSGWECQEGFLEEAASELSLEEKAGSQVSWVRVERKGNVVI